MAEYTHTNLPVHGRHVPEQHRTVNQDGTVDVVELPGMYEIGVEIEGIWRPLFTIKAGKLLSKIEAAKSGSGNPTPSQ